MRIAFLADEFIIEKPNAGGLGNYLNRMTKALKDSGHEPEIFVRRQKKKTPEIIYHNKIRVEHVSPCKNISYKILRKFDDCFLKSPWGGFAEYLATSIALSKALDRRHRENPFDLVQSSNTSACGLFVKKCRNRPHLIRLSSHRGLWFELDGRYNLGARILCFMEKLALRKADIAYAPSRFVAEYCKLGWRKDVQVVRPPMQFESVSVSTIPENYPKKYLIHFGTFCKRKGSLFLAKALLKVWAKAPDVKMVWAGRFMGQQLEGALNSLWGKYSENVIYVGSLNKSELYPAIKGSKAAVLPSLADNLPNTVIECISFGIPVIGTKSASIDEIVKDGINGKLVGISDEDELASAILSIWNDKVSFKTSDPMAIDIYKEYEASNAVNNLLAIVNNKVPIHPTQVK